MQGFKYIALYDALSYFHLAATVLTSDSCCLRWMGGRGFWGPEGEGEVEMVTNGKVQSHEYLATEQREIQSKIDDVAVV